MNLSVLEKMAQVGDLSLDATRYLLNCRGECEWLDYKENINLEEDKELCGFTKDVLALKNVGGGYILIGVKDKSWEPIGLKCEIPYDTKMLRDKIRRASGVELEIDIVSHELSIINNLKKFALILVRASRKRRKRRSPTIVKNDFCVHLKFGLKRGDIYVRKGDSTTKIQSAEELQELLDSLEEQADEDALVATGYASPFAIEDGTYRLLETGFDQFVGREDLRQDVLSAVTQDPRIWIVNVHGPGGVGKSALVNWAAYEFYREREFEAILQLTAKETILTPEGIRRYGRSLYSLENLLDHICVTFEEPIPTDLEAKIKLALELLSAWKTLLILDNMETITDGRILTFIQRLPVDSKSKVLITSRQKTGSWELPLPVKELSRDDVFDFLRVRIREMDLNCALSDQVIDSIWHVSGGLPLAIQWILGRCRFDGNLDAALNAVEKKDSPVLEFSFGNIWKVLSEDAKAILAIMTIFDEPPTIQQICIATDFQIDRVEKTLSELSDVTLVSRNTQMSDGRIRYVALPITLSFARHQLSLMGEYEINCRQRFQKYNEQMKLQESELFKFRSRFERYGLESDNEKKAAILCQRGESEMFTGNVDNADMLFKQARELAPQSAYVYAMNASYCLARNRIGVAKEFIEVACSKATKKNGSLCYTIKARILDVQRDRYGRLEALGKALQYDSDNPITRHQYGVALSRVGKPEKAIDEFTKIIEKEKEKIPPTETLLMALKTRIINLRRMGRESEANADLDFGNQLLDAYPHLQNQIPHFQGLGQE